MGVCASFRVAKLACDMKVIVGIFVPAADQSIERLTADPTFPNKVILLTR